MNENYKYEVLEKSEQPGETKIKKSGLTAEFTLNDIARDIQLLEKKKVELNAQIGVEDAKMRNIDRTNPEIGQMDTNMRQVIYLYERSYAFSKVGKEKVEEIDKLLDEYKTELMDITVQTGLVLTASDEQ
jgi:hypothetical protein